MKKKTFAATMAAIMISLGSGTALPCLQTPVYAGTFSSADSVSCKVSTGTQYAITYDETDEGIVFDV